MECYSLIGGLVAAVISINVLQFVPSSDISLEHKIFSHGRISALLQYSKFG